MPIKPGHRRKGEDPNRDDATTPVTNRTLRALVADRNDLLLLVHEAYMALDAFEHYCENYAGHDISPRFKTWRERVQSGKWMDGDFMQGQAKGGEVSRDDLRASVRAGIESKVNVTLMQAEIDRLKKDGAR